MKKQLIMLACMLIASIAAFAGTNSKILLQHDGGVKVYDSDHDYKKDIIDSYLNSPVQIGSYSWIGSDAIILRGSIVGNNSVVGAGAVVKANVPDNTLYVNQRTDKYITINRS